jgi:2-beta-glucuronyltransferase
MRKKAILISGHYWGSKRKAGFHWLADALARAGWDVAFFTAPISWISALRKDYRMAYPIREEANRLVPRGEGLWSYVWYTPFHPSDLRSSLANRLSQGIFGLYARLPLGPAEAFIREADLVLFESTPAILLFDRFKQLNSRARYVYRVSDDMRYLKNHPMVLEAEQRVAPLFDLVSVPSRPMLSKFEGLPHARHHLHGLQKDLFDRDYPNPYPRSETPHLVFVGNFLFDYDALERSSRLLPDWQFHIIGPLPNLPQRPNVRAYGEIPFMETLPYVQHADIGLQFRHYDTGADALGDSLKIIQYTYCKLPIVAPDFLKSSRTNLFGYTPGDDDSMKKAMLSAAQCDRSRISTEGIYSWDELAEQLVG